MKNENVLFIVIVSGTVGFVNVPLMLSETLVKTYCPEMSSESSLLITAVAPLAHCRTLKDDFDKFLKTTAIWKH